MNSVKNHHRLLGILHLVMILFLAGCSKQDAFITTDMTRDFDSDHSYQLSKGNENEHVNGCQSLRTHDAPHGKPYANQAVERKYQ